MGWDGSGNFVASDGTNDSPGICVAQAGDGDAVIRATEMDAVIDDLNGGIHACLAKNGENAATANLDAGGFKLTNLGASSANTDAARHGKDVASGVYSGGNLTLTLNDGTTVVVDLSSLVAGTGGVDLTTAQTVAGIKTMTSITPLAHAKFNGPTTSKVLTPTPGANVTIDTTGATRHWLTVAVDTDITFTWPTSASDTQLGANWCVSGEVKIRTTASGKTMTLNASMLSALTDYEEEGSPATDSGRISTLTYSYFYIGGSKYAQFAWVATP